jgi:hypothetical protein
MVSGAALSGNRGGNHRSIILYMDITAGKYHSQCRLKQYKAVHTTL